MPIKNRRRRWQKQKQNQEEKSKADPKGDLQAQEEARAAEAVPASIISTSLAAGAAPAAAAPSQMGITSSITSSLPMLGGQLVPWAISSRSGSTSTAGSSLQALSARMQSAFGMAGASTVHVVKIEHSSDPSNAGSTSIGIAPHQASGTMIASPPRSQPVEQVMAQNDAMETFRSWHAWGSSVLDNAAAGLAAFVDPDQQASVEGMSPGQGGAFTSGGDARFYIIAWDGPRKGQCNADTVSLKELAELASLGHLPTDALVWAEDEGTVDGLVHWQPLWKVLRMRKDDKGGSDW